MNLTTSNTVASRRHTARRLGQTAGDHGGKRKPRTRLWKHPREHSIRLPYRMAAAIAVMEMGIREYAVIARAVGLSVKEIERIDMATDGLVRRLALIRIPIDETFKLEARVRCPRCQADVGLAPCVACRCLQARQIIKRL